MAAQEGNDSPVYYPNYYTHIEKGHTYVILGDIKSKHPDTGEWYDAIIYKQLESGESFVRSKESFKNNFKVIEK